MLNLFHVGPKGFNIGNHAIAEGLNHLLRETFGQVVNVISIPATSQFESHGRAGLSASVVHEINQYGDGLIIGGGNLYENGQLTVDHGALRALEVPLMLISLSWGRIYNRNHELVRRTDAMPDETIRALDQAATVSLGRDAATVTHLQSIGAEKVRLGGCPTLFLGNLVDRLPTISEMDQSRTLVSIRNPQLMSVPLPVQQRTSTDITAIIDELRDRGSEPVLLCHDHRDVPFAASFENVDFLYSQDVFVFLKLLQTARLNVTYRLHSALPSICMDTPFVKLSYDERSVSLMETIGMHDWNIDVVSDTDPMTAVRDRLDRIAELPTALAASEPTRDALRTSMADAVAEFRDHVLECKK